MNFCKESCKESSLLKKKWIYYNNAIKKRSHVLKINGFEVFQVSNIATKIYKNLNFPGEGYKCV